MTGPDLPQLSPESRAFCDDCTRRARTALGRLNEIDECDDAAAADLIQEAIGQLVLLFAEHDMAADR